MKHVGVLLALVLALAGPAFAHPLYPDEPAGWSQLVRHQFVNKTNNGLCQDLSPLGDAVILSDSSLTTSPPFFLRDQKQPNQGHGGTSINCAFNATKNVFWGFRMRTSNPFGGYDNGANKIGFVLNNRTTGGGAQWGLHYYGASNGGRVISVFLQDAQVNNCHITNLNDGGFNQCATLGGLFMPNMNGSSIAEGADHRIELTLIGSTTSTSRDGVVRLVVDGILRTYNTNVNFPQFGFISVQNNHTWDGQCEGRGDCRPFLDYYDFDDWYVSTGSGGSSTTPPPPPVDTTPPGMVSGVTVQQLN